MANEATIHAGRVELRIALEDGMLTLDVGREGACINMASDHRESVTPSEFVAEWAQHMRGMLSRIESWGSRSTHAGRWTLTAEMFPTACVWAAHWTVRPHREVAVLFDACGVRTKAYHGERVQRGSAVVKRARRWVEGALSAWIDEVEAKLLTAVKGWTA